eukprot:m.1384870 g.1384870  ORF g.1384870 m.1384870 type:complete len:257 (-) comp24975_c1_seq24:5201-5971(-)
MNNTQVVFMGVISGVFTRQMNFYSDGACTSILFSAAMEGIWIDQGALEGFDNVRKVMYNFTAISVTPLSADGVTYLSSNCSCTGKIAWQQSRPEPLIDSASDCPPYSCDTQFLGGSIDPLATGLLLGQPAFGTYQIQEAGGVFQSRVDSQPLLAWNQTYTPYDNYTNLLSIAACTTTNVPDICGSYDTLCTPIIGPDSALEGSRRETFQWHGPEDFVAASSIVHAIEDDYTCHIHVHIPKQCAVTTWLSKCAISNY